MISSFVVSKRRVLLPQLSLESLLKSNLSKQCFPILLKIHREKLDCVRVVGRCHRTRSVLEVQAVPEPLVCCPAPTLHLLSWGGHSLWSTAFVVLSVQHAAPARGTEKCGLHLQRDAQPLPSSWAPVS